MNYLVDNDNRSYTQQINWDQLLCVCICEGTYFVILGGIILKHLVKRSVGAQWNFLKNLKVSTVY